MTWQLLHEWQSNQFCQACNKCILNRCCSIIIVSFSLWLKKVGLFFHVCLEKEQKWHKRRFTWILIIHLSSIWMDGQSLMKDAQQKGLFMLADLQPWQQNNSIENGFQIAAGNREQCQQASSRITAIIVCGPCGVGAQEIAGSTFYPTKLHICVKCRYETTQIYTQ